MIVAAGLDPAFAFAKLVVDLLWKRGEREAAVEQYRMARLSEGNDVERRFLQRRLAEVTAVGNST